MLNYFLQVKISTVAQKRTSSWNFVVKPLLLFLRFFLELSYTFLLVLAGRLFDLLKETKVGFSPSLVLHLFRQIVEAVEFLHSQRPPIIHRDLKVTHLFIILIFSEITLTQIENLLIKKDGRIALCDFGSATSQVLFPNKISEVKRAEEEIQKYTTPQYRFF
jgi:serine/threonine protein kinase